MNQKVFFISYVAFITVHFVACVYYSTSKIPVVMKRWEGFITESTNSESQFDEIFWQVAVLMKQHSAALFLCSGVLLHERFVLTAAECVGQLRPQELSIATDTTLQVHSSQLVGNYTDVYNVSEVFSPSPSWSQKRKDDDLVVLKLESEIRFDLPQLPAVSPSTHQSEHCFTLGWGIHSYNEAKWRYKCPQYHSADVFLRKQKQFKINRLFDIRNTFGLSSMLVIRVGQMFNIFALFHPKWVNTDVLLKETCSEVGEPREAKASTFQLTLKPHYRCPCSDGPHLCLHSWNTQHSHNKVDIGSPVFCEIKKHVSKNNDSNMHGITEYGLAGIVTHRRKDGLAIGSCNSSIDVIKATDIANFSRFLSAVLHYET